MPHAQELPVRAFVAGSTGYVGRAVVQHLQKRGVPTTAHVRPDSTRLEEWAVRFGSPGVIMDTTEWSEEAMAATIAKMEPTHVFALLGTSRKRARHSASLAERHDPYETVDYGLTVMLLRACVSSGMRPRLVYLSSLGADLNARNAYLSVRGRVERELRDSGLDYVVFRPSFISGPDREERRLAERLGATVTDAVVRLMEFLRLGRFVARLESMDADMLSAAIVEISLDASSANMVFERDQLPRRRKPSRGLPPSRNEHYSNGASAEMPPR